jgi:hypothetical protein
MNALTHTHEWMNGLLDEWIIHLSTNPKIHLSTRADICVITHDHLDHL